MTTIGVIGAGAMGSAVGQRLAESGARVITYLEGRGAKTVERAKSAKMEAVDLAEIATAELILSIVPPATATAVARSLVGVLSAAKTKPTYIDLNAINPTTMAEVAAILGETGCEVLDGSIIGGPPKRGGTGPCFYVCGDIHRRTDTLERLQLKVRRIDGALGAASALKMVYSGVNKGMIGLGAAMMLAAARSDAADSLRTEMSGSMPDVQARLRQSIPTMYPKAYRWVAEMLEISAFLGPGNPAAQIFEGMAGVFSMFADDLQDDGDLIALVDGALAEESKRTDH